MSVRPKKHLGQHFLKDESICQKIVQALKQEITVDQVVEIGPGTGALTKYLLQEKGFETSVIEVDTESVDYLEKHYPQLKDRIYCKDFLKMDPNIIVKGENFAVVGNFPYNISSQILFKVLQHKDQVPLVVGMFQKEVAERIAEKPGSKKYGIISVLLQAFYDIDYLFTVDEHVFDPPPKVKSAVIQLRRNAVNQLDCDEQLFTRLVKLAFNQRRKTLRNSIKTLVNEKNPEMDLSDDFFQRRPETLSVDEFVGLTQRLMV